MPTEADIRYPGGTETVTGFTRIEETTLGTIRVFYDPDDAHAGFNPAEVMGPSDEGLLYEDYDGGEIVAVRVDENERDPQLMV